MPAWCAAYHPQPPFPLSVHQVDASAKLVVVTKTAAQIQLAAHLRVGGVVDTDLSGRRFFRPFRFKIDHAANAAGSQAIQQGVRPFEDLNPLQHLGIHHLTRHHARQPAHRHVVAVQLETADAIGFGEVTVSLHRLHTRVVADHVGDGLRLLILYQLRGIAYDVERNVHRFLFAQHSQAAAVGNLSIQVGGNQIIAAGVEIGVFFGPDDQGVLPVFLGVAVCGQRALAQRADSQRQQRFT